jgi:hypothetical protein
MAVYDSAKTKVPENPDRIRAFRETLAQLRQKQFDVTTLDRIFHAIDDLAEAEVRYYWRRRGTRAFVSGLTRIVAWLFGSIGLLIPLLASVEPTIFGFKLPWDKSVLAWGYIALGIAASSLAANALFGGTSGHVRFVQTQLKLEKLIADNHIEWFRLKAALDATPLDEATIAKAFELLRDYAAKLYEATLGETANWGETVTAELARFEQSIRKTNQNK